MPDQDKLRHMKINYLLITCKCTLTDQLNQSVLHSLTSLPLKMAQCCSAVSCRKVSCLLTCKMVDESSADDDRNCLGKSRVTTNCLALRTAFGFSLNIFNVCRRFLSCKYVYQVRVYIVQVDHTIISQSIRLWCVVELVNNINIHRFTRNDYRSKHRYAIRNVTILCGLELVQQFLIGTKRE